MSKEQLGKRERRLRRADWAGRLIGVPCVAATCMLSSGWTSSLTPEAVRYNPGVSLEESSPEQAAQEVMSVFYDEKTGLTRDTGMDSQPCDDYAVCGTDMGQPFFMPDGTVCNLFGDTFAVAGPFLKNLPDGADKYRAQAMLCSSDTPVKGQPIFFDRAPGLEGTGIAPETLGQWHIYLDDGVSLPNGDIVVSYQHTIEVENPKDHTTYTDYAGLAVSHDNGDSFEKTGPIWQNDIENNLDPYQIWSMQYNDADGYVYIISVRAGRRPGPMMLFRVPWDKMLDSQDAYQYWNGADWGAKADATPLQTGQFGEQSLRKLSDGTWIMSYADYTGYPKIVTKTLADPTLGLGSKWNDAKVHLTARELPNLYGGGIDPRSTADNLILMISTWQTKGSAKAIQDRELVRYDVSHLISTAK